MTTTKTKTCATCAYCVNRKNEHLKCVHPSGIDRGDGSTMTLPECRDARSDDGECGPDGLNYLRGALAEDWLSSLVFQHAGGVQPGRASGQVGEHLAGHRVEVPITGPGFEQRAKFAEIRLAGAGERQHEMSQHLLGDVQRFEVVFVEHGKPSVTMLIEGADAVAAVAKAMLSE